MKFCFSLLSLIFLSHHTQTYGQIAFQDAIALDEANQKKDYSKFLQILANQYKGKSPIISIDELKTEFINKVEITYVLTNVIDIIVHSEDSLKFMKADTTKLKGPALPSMSHKKTTKPLFQCLAKRNLERAMLQGFTLRFAKRNNGG